MKTSRFFITISCALATFSVGSGNSVHAATRANPFEAWPEPKINENMSIDQAKAVVAERTKPQDQWKGPTNGPKAATGDATVVYVSGDSPTRPLSIGAKVSWMRLLP
jgi:ribose transport system substrate-binding protein